MGLGSTPQPVFQKTLEVVAGNATVVRGCPHCRGRRVFGLLSVVVLQEMVQLCKDRSFNVLNLTVALLIDPRGNYISRWPTRLSRSFHSAQTATLNEVLCVACAEGYRAFADALLQKGGGPKWTWLYGIDTIRHGRLRRPYVHCALCLPIMDLTLLKKNISLITGKRSAMPQAEETIALSDCI